MKAAGAAASAVCTLGAWAALRRVTLRGPHKEPLAYSPGLTWLGCEPCELEAEQVGPEHLCCGVRLSGQRNKQAVQALTGALRSPERARAQRKLRGPPTALLMHSALVALADGRRWAKLSGTSRAALNGHLREQRRLLAAAPAAAC